MGKDERTFRQWENVKEFLLSIRSREFSLSLGGKGVLRKDSWGALWVQLFELPTLYLGVVSSRPTLGVELT